MHTEPESCQAVVRGAPEALVREVIDACCRAA